MKFKRYIDLSSNNLFESVFERYYSNGFFGNIDKKVIKEQQIQWCMKICKLVESADIDTLCECLESRDAKTSREWVSVIIATDILADSRSDIRSKLSKILSEETTKEKIKSNAQALAGDALIAANLLGKVVSKGLSNIIDFDVIKKSIQDFKDNFKRGASWFKEGDPFETKEFLERHQTGTLKYGSKKEKTQDGEIFQIAVGYDYGEFVGFLLMTKKSKDGMTSETSFIPVTESQFDKIMNKMDRNSINVIQKAIKVNIGNKIHFFVRSHGDSIPKLTVDCDIKNKKCKVIEDKNRVLFEKENFGLKKILESDYL